MSIYSENLAYFNLGKTADDLIRASLMTLAWHEGEGLPNTRLRISYSTLIEGPFSGCITADLYSFGNSFGKNPFGVVISFSGEGIIRPHYLRGIPAFFNNKPRRTYPVFIKKP